MWPTVLGGLEGVYGLLYQKQGVREECKSKPSLVGLYVANCVRCTGGCIWLIISGTRC